MKVTFVYPDLYQDYPDWPGGLYIGLASLSAVLKKEKHQTSLIHITQPIMKNDFINRIRNEDPDLIGFSSTSHTFPYVKELAAWLFEVKIKIPTIYGGVHPTIAPVESIGIEGIEMICRGEGEAPLVELCRKMEDKEDIGDIPNLWVKANGTIRRNPLRPLLEDLDKLPFPDRSLFDYQNLMEERQGVCVFLASRGCPYKCTYCSNQLLRKIYGSKGKPVRFRSVDSLIGEIKDVLEHYPFIHTVHFHDDILFLKRKWSEEFAEKYRKEVNLPFMCNVRADLTNDAVVKLLKKAGCTFVKIGLESGNEEIRSKVLNRHMSNEQIKKAFALCKKAGLITLSYNMVGIPYETPGAILDTIKLNASVSTNFMNVTIYQPYKGTRLGELCREKGLVESRDLGSTYFAPTILKLNTVSFFQISMFRNYFKPLMRYYRVLQNCPPFISDILIRLSDKIFSFDLTAKVLNLIYPALHYFSLSARLSRKKSPLARLKASDHLSPVRAKQKGTF
jgi:radical SAM superfamily enzyme YgiQ (UPF0313 family)